MPYTPIRRGAGALFDRRLDEMLRELFAGMPVTQAENEVLSTFGDRVSVERKAKTLLKFGKNDNLGTSLDTVWNQGGNETFPTTNAITHFSSSSGSDSGELKIEGHTVTGTGADAQFTFVTQTVTLAGQTKTALTTPLARVSRGFNDSSTAWVGDIYIYEDDTVTAGVPGTAAKIHLKVQAGDNQSFKAATTFSNTDYAFLTNASFAVNKKTSATVDFELEIRRVGGVFRPVKKLSLSSAGQSAISVYFDPYIIVPKNADVRVRAAASTTGVSVQADFQAYLAVVI